MSCNLVNNYGYLPENLITHSQVCVLSRLWIEDGLTQKQISSQLEIKPASITTLVNTLVSKIGL